MSYWPGHGVFLVYIVSGVSDTPRYIFARLRPDMAVRLTDLEGVSDFVTVYWSMRSADSPLPACAALKSAYSFTLFLLALAERVISIKPYRDFCVPGIILAEWL